MSDVTTTVELADEAATEQFGESLAGSLRVGDFVALDGSLGAGKTTFVRGLARGLGIDSRCVASPTFVTMQIYAGDRAELIHIDLWRMKDPSELESIGWDELLASSSSVIVVEWASRIAEALPARRIDVAIDFCGTTRTATIVDRRTPSNET